MKRVVVLNCPPRSGKDTIALQVSEKMGFGILSFKAKLVEIALTISGVDSTEWDYRYKSDLKEQPWDKLGGLSQRNYLIKISEEWVKPLHGKTYFGERVFEDIQRGNFENYIIPDGGFKEELLPLRRGLPNGLLILQWGREGCTFEYDSRDYVLDYPSITRRIRNNNTSIEEQTTAVINEIKNFWREL